MNETKIFEYFVCMLLIKYIVIIIVVGTYKTFNENLWIISINTQGIYLSEKCG